MCLAVVGSFSSSVSRIGSLSLGRLGCPSLRLRRSPSMNRIGSLRLVLYLLVVILCLLPPVPNASFLGGLKQLVFLSGMRNQ